MVQRFKNVRTNVLRRRSHRSAQHVKDECEYRQSGGNSFGNPSEMYTTLSKKCLDTTTNVHDGSEEKKIRRLWILLNVLQRRTRAPGMHEPNKQNIHTPKSSSHLYICSRGLQPPTFNCHNSIINASYKQQILRRKTNKCTSYDYIPCLLITPTSFDRLLRPPSGCTVLKSTIKSVCGESSHDLFIVLF